VRSAFDLAAGSCVSVPDSVLEMVIVVVAVKLESHLQRVPGRFFSAGTTPEEAEQLLLGVAHGEDVYRQTSRRNGVFAGGSLGLGGLQVVGRVAVTTRDKAEKVGRGGEEKGVKPALRDASNQGFGREIGLGKVRPFYLSYHLRIYSVYLFVY
jgi:hypothetical protein